MMSDQELARHFGPARFDRVVRHFETESAAKAAVAPEPLALERMYIADAQDAGLDVEKLLSSGAMEGPCRRTRPTGLGWLARLRRWLAGAHA